LIYVVFFPNYCFAAVVLIATNKVEYICPDHPSCHGWKPGLSQLCQVSSNSVEGFWLEKGSQSAIFLCLALWFYNRLGLPPYTCDSHISVVDKAKN